MKLASVRLWVAASAQLCISHPLRLMSHTCNSICGQPDQAFIIKDSLEESLCEQNELLLVLCQEICCPFVRLIQQAIYLLVGELGRKEKL